MKKSLLLASAALVAAGTVYAADDNYAYPVMDGLKCENLWLKARNYNNYTTATDLPFVANNDFDRCRTMAIKDNYMLIGYSHKLEVDGTLKSGFPHIIILDLETGAHIRTILCTVDGEMIEALLAANQVGVDDFGNVWYTSYHENFIRDDGSFRSIDVYKVDDLETGASSLAFSLTLPEGEASYGPSRTDFYDLVGDVTGTEAPTVFMTVGCENSPEPVVFGWVRDQGSSKFEPHMSDNGYVANPVSETYPADQTTFNYGSIVSIVRDEDFTGDLYYIDGYTTYPALYNTAGDMIDNIGAGPEEARPDDVGANGIIEFSIAGNDYWAYPQHQYTKGGGWEFNVAKTGPDKAFEGMQLLWTLPEKGQGTLTDGGIRYHCLQTKKITDAAGKEGVLLAQFKTHGGLGVYRIAQEGFNAGVQDVFVDNSDANAPAEYFTLQGVKVENPAAGQLVIKRQGSTVEKLIVR